MAYTVYDAMVLCGIDDAARYHGDTACVRIATEMFDDDFNSCMDKTMTEVDSDLKAWSTLTANQGQIRLSPGTKKKLKAFMQWCRDMIRVGQDPASQAFPVAQTPLLIKRMKEHDAYVKKSSALSDTAKPGSFTEQTKWEDWRPVFNNFLRSIPGRNGIPLSYVVRRDDNPTAIPDVTLLDEYINGADLTNEAFKVDAAEVHTYIVNFIAGNQRAEAKILPISEDRNGREDYKLLSELYEGVGINAIAIKNADKILDNLLYQGENQPQMWWDEFKKRLNTAFTTYDKSEGRSVYSDEMKLRILCKKVKADFLQGTRQVIGVAMNSNPMTMTYSHAMLSFRTEVHNKFPPTMTASQRSRRMAELNKNRDDYLGCGRGRGHGRWQG